MILHLLTILITTTNASMNPGTDRIGNDPFSNYEWPLHFSGQTIFREIDDLRSEEVSGSISKSYEISSFVSKLEANLTKTPIVAVIDSGVDLDHEDLQDAILKNDIECDAGKLPYPSNIDKDGNGFPGDCMGWNFTAANLGDNRPYDDKGHGTHVSGIIAATKGNGKGIAGVSNKIKILPLKVLKGKENSETVSIASLTDRITNAIDYAMKRNADVINLSLGWPRSLNTPKVTAAIKRAYDSGIIIIAAAGNNGSTAINYPCLYDEVICVGATSINSELAPFSNTGSAVDIYAPGESILSTYPKKITSMLFPVQGYEIKNGTSQGAPYISAIAALLKAADQKLTSTEIVAKISTNKLLNLSHLDEPVSLFTSPNLKGVSNIYVDQSGNFKFSLVFKNHGITSSAEIATTIIHKKSDQSFMNDKRVVELATNETKLLEFSGNLSDLEIDNRALLKIEITENGITRDFASDLEVVHSIDKSMLQSTSLSGFDTTNLIQTISDRNRLEKRPSYFQVAARKDDQVLRVFHLAQNLFHELSISKDEKILSIQKLDLNLDQNVDLLLRTLDSKKRIIRYYYLKHDLFPLFRSFIFDFVPEVYSFDPSATFFHPIATPQGNMLIPLSLGLGKTPATDLSTNPWEQVENEKENHLFYLLPDFATNKFTTRIIDNLEFKQDLNHLIENYDDTISLVSLHGNIDSIGKGSFNVVLAIGNGYQGKTYDVSVINLKQNGFNHLPLSYAMAVGGQSLLSINVSKGGEVAGENFSSLQNDTLLLKESSSESFSFEVSDPHNKIVAFMPSFITPEASVSAIQTKRELILLNHNRTLIQESIYPIKRTSFLDSDKFTELFTPLVLNNSPAFYVDATAINSNHIYLLTLSNDGVISSPIKSSISVPQGCSAMNPSLKTDGVTFIFKCEEKGSIKIYSYEI